MLPDGVYGDITVGGRTIGLASLSKTVLPASEGRPAWTKRDTLSYYLQVADRVIGRCSGRCTTMVRYPQGPGRPLYLKSAPPSVLDWVTSADGPAGGGVRPYVVVDRLETLVWAVNFGAFEFHAPMLTTAGVEGDVPTDLVFDLDPGPGVGLEECCQVALELPDVCGLPPEAFSFKTSGSKGLHMLTPNSSGMSSDRALAWSEEVACQAAGRLPGLVTADTARSARAGRVLVDWQQNRRHRTTAVAWSLRLTSGLGVSTPVTYGEVAACAAGRAGLTFTPDEAVLRARSGQA